jgi:hypothetical protein
MQDVNQFPVTSAINYFSQEFSCTASEFSLNFSIFQPHYIDDGSLQCKAFRAILQLSRQAQHKFS